MRVTPLDIIQKEFTVVSRRGYRPEEVAIFLDEIRESLEDVLNENQRLKDLLLTRENEIATLRRDELGIKDTLLLARQLSSDVRRQAHKEADIIVGEARIEAEKVLTAAHDEHRKTSEEIIRLRGLRLQYIAQSRAMLQAQTQLLSELEAATDTLKD